jgi:hypothetical protein
LSDSIRKSVGEFILYGIFVLIDVLEIYPLSHLLGLSAFVLGTIALCLVEKSITLRWTVIAGIATSILSAFLYFAFPYSPAAPVVGWLQPANEPTPPNGCDREPAPPNSLLVLFGDNGALSLAPTTKFTAFRLEECPLVAIQTGPNGALINATIYSIGGVELGRVTNNKFMITSDRQLTIEKSGDLSMLVVHDDFGAELIYIHYINRTTIRVRGIFTCPTPTLRTVSITDTSVGTAGFQQSCFAGPSTAFQIN